MRKFLASLISPFKARPWLLTLPFFLLEGLFLVIIQYKHGFKLTDHILISALLQNLVFDSLIFLSGAMLLRLMTRTNIVPVIYMILYLYLTGQDMVIYFFGNTFFEEHFLNLISWYSIKGFVNVYSLSMLFVFLGASAGVFFLCRKVSVDFRFADLLRYSLIIATVYFADPTEYFIKKSEIVPDKRYLQENETRNIHYILRCKNEQLRYASRNSLINFVTEVFFRKGKKEYAVYHSAEALKKDAGIYSIPLGERKYEKVSAGFNKIVWLASESISLDFFSRYNPKIPFDTVTSFYESDEFFEKTMTNYYTSASPTLQALVSTFTSHPNYDLILSGYYQNSIAGILKKHGYETVFLRSASKYYAGENIIFQKLGFKDIIAREYFQQFPEYKEYIYDWGVSDRVMLGKLVDLLEEYRNKKLFVVVLGIDTHPPHGREEYGFRTTVYPETPSGYQNFGNASMFMKSVYNHDYDMANTLKAIKEKGLYTDDTLIVATADHACPYNNVVKYIPGVENTNLGRTPLAFFTPAVLPAFDRTVLSSQLDLAPSILHLLNIEIPQGYWGESLFSKTKKPLFTGYSRGVIEMRTGDDKMSVNKKSRSKKDAGLIRLFNSVIIEKNSK